MEGYKLRINKAIESLDLTLEALLLEKRQLESEIKRLKDENISLKKLTRSAALKLDGYIKELEEIRRNHGNSNVSD